MSKIPQPQTEFWCDLYNTSMRDSFLSGKNERKRGGESL